MKALADKLLEVWNEGNLSLLDEILSPEVVRHEVDISEDIIGIEANKENVTSTEDKSIGRWTVTGTNTGPYGELPPTGEKMKISGINVNKVTDGKIIEQWVYYNQAAALTQLGFTIIPPETQTEQ
jgi:hypothetical protein